MGFRVFYQKEENFRVRTRNARFQEIQKLFKYVYPKVRDEDDSGHLMKSTGDFDRKGAQKADKNFDCDDYNIIFVKNLNSF